MSMLTHVKLLRSDEDPDYRRKADAVWALLHASIYSLPKELAEFFGIDEATEFEEGVSGLEVGDEKHTAVRDCRCDGSLQTGFEIDLTKVPEGVRYVRVINSW